MVRPIVLCLPVLLLLACGENSGPDVMRAPMADMAMESRQSAAAAPPPGASMASGGSPAERLTPKLAYAHAMSLEMAADKVAPRFESARNACLNTAALNCSLTHASISVGDLPSASLTVRLPRAQLPAFEKILLAPLAGEGKGDPMVRERSTDAEDLTYAILDVDRRLAQATGYRERLSALAQRNAKVEELIQVEEKISEVQTNIESMTAQQRGFYQRVETETLTVNLRTYGVTTVSSPLAQAWRDAGRVLGSSTAAAFTFAVMMLPWIPIVALIVFLASRLWRFVRRRRAAKVAVAAVPVNTAPL